MLVFKKFFLFVVFAAFCGMVSILFASDKTNDLEKLYREGSCPNGNFRGMEIKNLTIKKKCQFQRRRLYRSKTA